MPTSESVSLEDHLLSTLTAVLPVLPENVAYPLQAYLSSPQIPYQLLQDISRWSRSQHARESLQAHNLDPAAYSIVALLAGSTTSPDRKFPRYIPPKDPAQLASDQNRERKLITALANSVLSVAGVAIAALWASEKTGWKLEWRALFALSSAILVAIAEAGLFLTWQWRNSNSTTSHSSPHKKHDPIPDQSPVQQKDLKSLRRRRVY